MISNDPVSGYPECPRYGRRGEDGDGQLDQECGEARCRELLPEVERVVGGSPIHFPFSYFFFLTF